MNQYEGFSANNIAGGNEDNCDSSYDQTLKGHFDYAYVWNSEQWCEYEQRCDEVAAPSDSRNQMKCEENQGNLGYWGFEVWLFSQKHHAKAEDSC